MQDTTASVAIPSPALIVGVIVCYPWWPAEDRFAGVLGSVGQGIRQSLADLARHGNRQRRAGVSVLSSAAQVRAAVDGRLDDLRPVVRPAGLLRLPGLSWWPARLPCPHCGQRVPRDRPACFACGRDFPRRRQRGSKCLRDESVERSSFRSRFLLSIVIAGGQWPAVRCWDIHRGPLAPGYLHALFQKPAIKKFFFFKKKSRIRLANALQFSVIMEGWRNTGPRKGTEEVVGLRTPIVHGSLATTSSRPRGPP